MNSTRFQGSYSLYSLTLLALLATGCQQIPHTPQATETTQKQIIIQPPKQIIDIQQVDYTDMYIRGTFSWWAAKPEFRLTRLSSTLYKGTVSLVADGESYDFKLADKDYNSGKNCGFASSKGQQLTSSGTPVLANCNVEGNYFQFMPTKNGSYDFFFDVSSQQPKIYIKPASR